MTQEEVYKFIGDLAMSLYLKNIKITFSSLKTILADPQRNIVFKDNHELANKGIKAAYHYWEDEIGDEIVPSAIALTFTNKDGKYAWDLEKI